MTLRLNGFNHSNYYNILRIGMLEKNLPFEEVKVSVRDPEYRKVAAMGKVPSLETDEGVLIETSVIIDYLEDICPEPALMPAAPFARAKVREMIRVLDLHLELVARSLYAEAFFGGTVSDEVKAATRPLLAKGLDAFTRLASFDDYLCGGEYSWADIVAVVHLPLIGSTTRRIYNEDPLAALPGLPEYLQRIKARPLVQKVRGGVKK